MKTERIEAATHFINEYLPQHAEAWDRDETTPEEALVKMADAGMFGYIVPEEFGGSYSDTLLPLGELCESLATQSPAVQSQITVHSMVCYSVVRWGSKALKEKYLARLASGELRGAFALSEELAGSDPSGMETVLEEEDGTLTLNGTKKWTTYGTTGGVFLVFARYRKEGKDSGFTALLLDREHEGFNVTPLPGMQGFKASNTAELSFDNCVIDRSQVVGMPGFGLNAVVPSCLSVGRFCVAWGSIGMMKYAVRSSLNYTSSRKQGGKVIKQHQLVSRLLTDMITQYKAARSMAVELAHTYSQAPARFMPDSFLVKYFATRDLSRYMSDAIQVQGAKGLHNYRMQQMLLDAKVMEIIEGSTQIQQQTIPELYEKALLKEWEVKRPETIMN